jgi:flagellar hook-associated protein 3 FlgL
MLISTKQIFQNQLSGMANLQNSMASLQEKISSGKAVEAPSDDPIAFANALNLKDQKSSIDQFNRNINNAQNRLNLQDSTLKQAANVITRMQELVIQGTSDTNGASDRQAIALELTQLKQQIADLGNTRDSNGDYVFAGFKSNTQPFVADSTGAVSYVGDTNRQEVSISDSAKVVTASNGQEVFMSIHSGDGPTQSIFAIADKAIAAFQANQPNPGSVSEFKSALEQVSNYQAITGARLARLDAQKTSNDSQSLNVKTSLSLVEDADITQLVTELKQKMNSMDAANASFAKIVGTTLFDYIK